MFDIRITVGRIDYKQTISALFPAALNKCRELEHPGMLFRLFLELGEDALSVLLGIVERLSESAKQELLCQLMNGYHQVLTEKFNEYLQRDPLGRNFVFQKIYVQQKDEELILVGEGVEVDYKSFFASSEVRSKVNETALSIKGLGGIGKAFANHAGSVLRTAAGAAPKSTETIGLKFVQREEIKEKLMVLIQAALQKRGLIMELKSLSFVQVGDDDAISGTTFDPVKLSAELETELIKALAEYIRALLK